MASKRKANDENSGQFINTSGPPQKRPRRVPQTVTEASRMEARRQWEEKQREEAAAKADFLAQREREEEAERRATSTLRIGQVLDTVKAAGYKTLHEFLADLLATKDQHQSSQVSQTLINHGDELLELIRARQPELVSQWISKVAGETLKEEGAKLAQLLRPPQGQGVAASRRDDIDLLDNLGRYGKEQLGIFHEKVAGTRMTVNEHWGTPNSKSLWSLWKINSLLGRKPITAGWKSKKLPPFRPAYELMIDLTLPANILDGFRIICPRDTIEEWAESVPDWQSVRDVAAKVHQQLCSARRVSKLRRQPASKRDPIFENISLFNRDALTLLALRAAVKRGDVGGVLCVSAHWMVMFRGTGHMPKYADAIFRVLTELKSMHPKLREAYLMNWLANLSGKLLGFKEMDLLQEHQNFWLKVIYNARGSNRSWEWLGMISVSIFALRDVIRRVQLEYKIPHNSKSHSNPSTAKDIRAIRDYLELHKLQSVYPERADNDLALTARDLMETGAAYANTARAFKTFRPDNRKATNLGTAHGSACPVEVDDDEFADPDNYGQDLDLDLGDLVLDEEEFPAGLILQTLLQWLLRQYWQWKKPSCK
ncbi:hypothetical protein B0H14DRAFT_3165853 [Mycena olivaceomarginata]|nr:hypothetical protein B0H14DRAFT_3165853 [Mycena olivaceomarginata]